MAIKPLAPGHVIVVSKGTKPIYVFTSTDDMLLWSNGLAYGEIMTVRRTDVPVDRWSAPKTPEDDTL